MVNENVTHQAAFLVWVVRCPHLNYFPMHSVAFHLLTSMKREQAMPQLGNLIAHQNQAEHPIAETEHVPMEQLHVIFLAYIHNTHGNNIHAKKIQLIRLITLH